MVAQLQEAVHPSTVAALPEAFRRAVAAEQAASRFPLDAQSPLQLRDVRPPALRSLPDPDAVLATPPSWAVPGPAEGRMADSLRTGLHSDASGREGGDSEGSAGSSTSKAGVYIWHDGNADRKDRREPQVRETGSSTQPAAWLQGIQQKTQQEPSPDALPERCSDEEPRELVDDRLLPLGRM